MFLLALVVTIGKVSNQYYYFFNIINIYMIIIAQLKVNISMRKLDNEHQMVNWISKIREGKRKEEKKTLFCLGATSDLMEKR